jgi:hypothetical protein
MGGEDEKKEFFLIGWNIPKICCFNLSFAWSGPCDTFLDGKTRFSWPASMILRVTV